MDATIIVAIITALGPIVAIAVSGTINWKMGKSIHTLVNGQRSEMVDQIDSMRSEIMLLKKVVAGIHNDSTTPIDGLKK